MSTKTIFGLIGIFVSLVIFSSCGNPQIAEIDPTATPTPTKIMQVNPPTQTAVPSRCSGLGGELEIQILVGPAEIVGLEPVSVGSIPFSVTTADAPYLIQGGGGFNYADILVKEWGTYEVTMNMNGSVAGTCLADDTGGELALDLELTGSQLVVVTADGFNGEYPWEGTLPLNLNLPIEEGASASGEGFVIVLHLK